MKIVVFLVAAILFIVIFKKVELYLFFNLAVGRPRETHRKSRKPSQEKGDGTAQDAADKAAYEAADEIGYETAYEANAEWLEKQEQGINVFLII